MDIHEIRRRNVRQLIDEKFSGVQRRLALAIGTDATTVSRWWMDGEHGRRIGDEMARRIEEQLGLDRGWLDQLEGAPELAHTVVPLLEINELHNLGDARESASRQLLAPGAHPDGSFALQHRDDTMQTLAGPSLCAGSLAVFHPPGTDDTGLAGRVVIALDRGLPMLGEHVLVAGRVYLRPLNSAYPRVLLSHAAMIVGVLALSIYDWTWPATPG